MMFFDLLFPFARKSPPVYNIREWLEVATEGLCNRAKGRIMLEILAHFGETLDAERKNDKSPADAQSAALAALGDPKRAARAFRHANFTRKDTRLLQLMRIPVKWALFPLPFCLVWIAFRHAHSSWEVAASVLSGFVANVVVLKLVPELMTIRKYRRAYVWSCGLSILLASEMIFFIPPEPDLAVLPPIWRLLEGVVLAIFILALTPRLVITWRKLGGPHVDDDFPAGGGYA
jgi:hypothetical protein